MHIWIKKMGRGMTINTKNDLSQMNEPASQDTKTMVKLTSETSKRESGGLWGHN